MNQACSIWLGLAVGVALVEGILEKDNHMAVVDGPGTLMLPGVTRNPFEL